MNDIEIKGYIKPGFEKVGDAFIKNFKELRELGAGVSVFLGEESVVDIWGGLKSDGQKWQKDTLVNVWSTTKGFTSLAIHMLKSRGLLDFDKPVAYYWEEFAAAGKAEIPVRQILNHRSGMACWKKEQPVDILYDWEAAVRLLAEQEPLWEPGKFSGYHLLSYGHLAGEILRRIDGRMIDRFIQEEIADPLGLDFNMPVAEDDFRRISDVALMPDATKISTESRAKLSEIARLAFTNPLAKVFDANSTKWRQAVIPAANGHTTARDVAKLYALLANGGSFKETTLVSAEDIENMRQPSEPGVDLILGAGMDNKEMIWGMGYRINHDNSYGANSRAFYHGGFGGSLGFCDPEAGLGFGYVMNRMDLSSRSGSRAANLVNAVYDCI